MDVSVVNSPEEAFNGLERVDPSLDIDQVAPECSSSDCVRHPRYHGSFKVVRLYQRGYSCHDK